MRVTSKTHLSFELRHIIDTDVGRRKELILEQRWRFVGYVSNSVKEGFYVILANLLRNYTKTQTFLGT